MMHAFINQIVKHYYCQTPCDVTETEQRTDITHILKETRNNEIQHNENITEEYMG